MVKRLLALLLFATGLAQGQFTQTQNIGLEIPANGSTNWNVPLNYNFQLLDALIGGTTQNPGVGLGLKPVFGTGAPGIACSTSNQGQQYFDTSQTPFVGYICNGGLWTMNGGSSGGAFPSNALVFGLSSTTARAAQSSDISSLLSSGTNCSLSSYAYSPATNTCFAGAAIYPASGIANSTGTAWGTSYSTSGTGTVIPLTNSPTLITPVLGAATATSINGLPVLEAGANIFIGDGVTYSAGVSSDTSVGSQALIQDTPANGGANTAFGQAALHFSTYPYNAAFGVNSLENLFNGFNNSCFGAFSCSAATSAVDDAGFGQSVLSDLTTGQLNSAFGVQSLGGITTQGANSALGFDAGFNFAALTDTASSVYVGAYSGSSANHVTNQIVIGYNAQGSASNQTTIGSSVIGNIILWGIPQFPSITSGGTQCAQLSPTGTLSGTGSACGAGGGGSGNTTSTSLTTNFLPVANGANSLINSLLSDNGSALNYGGSSFTLTSSLPGLFSVGAGTGSLILPSNSASIMAPVTGGTSWALQFPASITTAGIAHIGTPATVNGVRAAQLTNSLIAIADLAATGTPGSTNYLRGDNTWNIPASQGTISSGWVAVGTTGANVVIGGTTPGQAGHFTNLQIVSGGGSCTTPPFFNVFDGASSVGTPKQAIAAYQSPGVATNQSQSITFAAGDNIGIFISTQGITCSNFFSVSAQYSTP